MTDPISNGFNGRPPGSMSMGINGQPASDFEVISQPPSSAMTNGSSLGLTNGSPVGLNVANMNPLMSASVTSGMSSITDFTLKMALQRIQELTKENEDLRDFLRQNTEMMKKQYDALTEYKAKVHAANTYNKEKFEETKILVLNLRAEKAVLKEENESLQRKLSDLETSQKAMTEHRIMTNSMVTALQAEIDTLKQQISREKTHTKDDVVVVSKMDVPANEENAKLAEELDVIGKENEELKTLNERLRNDVRQYKATADQLLSDLEGTQALKSEREIECKTLGKENAKLSSDVQKSLHDICEVRAEVRKLQQENAALLKQLKATAHGKGSDYSFEHLIDQSLLDVSFNTGCGPVQEEEEHPQQTAASQTTESLSIIPPLDSEKDFDESVTHNSNPMADIMEQLRKERETNTDLRSVNAEKNQEIQNLRQDLRSKEEVLLSKTTRFESSSADVTAEQEKAISDIRATTRKLEMATGSHSQMNSQEDINSLKSQVLTLINELHESQIKLTAATEALTAKNNKLEEIERQNVILSENLNRQREQDDFLIESMREALVNKEDAWVKDKAEHQETRKQLSALRVSFNQLVSDYRDLLETYDEFRISKEKEAAKQDPPVNYQDEIGRLMAQVIGGEEAIAFRDTQIQELRQELKQLKQEAEQVPVLRAQAEVYKCDFDAERKAREKQHAEKESILQDMVNLQTRNQQLVDELESYSRHQFAEMQQRHASKSPSDSAGGVRRELQHQYTRTEGQAANPSQTTPPEAQNSQRGYPYPVGEQTFGYPSPETIATQTRPAREQQLSPIVYPEPMHEEPLDFTALDEVYGCHHCPKCGMQCPDLDSLQIHVIECLDNDLPLQDPFRT